jgi:integrase
VEKIMPLRTFFFPKSQGKMYSMSWLYRLFRVSRVRSGVVQSGEHPPRLYDFRLTFATHRLYKWMSEGKDATAMLPYLSTYMGHTQISDTYYYIHLVPGMMETMSGMDYSFFSNLLPEVEADE